MQLSQDHFGNPSEGEPQAGNISDDSLNEATIDTQKYANICFLIGHVAHPHTFYKRLSETLSTVLSKTRSAWRIPAPYQIKKSRNPEHHPRLLASAHFFFFFF